MKLKPEECSLVVARYNENIDWLANFPNNLPIFVYNKNEIKLSNLKLPNIQISNRRNLGRETGTYLDHIIEHYDNLTPWTIFCQGNPFDHFDKFLDIFDNDIEELNQAGINWNQFYGLGEFYTNNKHKADEHEKYIWEHIDKLPKFLSKYVIKHNEISFTIGSQMIIYSTMIRKFSKHWYKKLLTYTEQVEVAPWVIETLWDKFWTYL